MDDPDFPASLRTAMGFPVTASLGPVGPLLRQLHSQPHKHLAFMGVREEEIQRLTKDLDGLCVSLMNHSEAEEPSLSWMGEVRELCYDVKNYFDDDPFIWKQEDEAQLTPEEKQEITQLKFNTLKDRVEHASKRRKRYEIDRQNIMKAKYLSVERRRFPVLLIDGGLLDTLATKLMGTPEEKQLKTVSLLGLEGVGKTTLAKRLYHQNGGQFQCRAFVRVSPKPDMRMLLTSIFTQIQLPGFFEEPACCLDAQAIITKIEQYLADKRYFIIIDDLWSIPVWDIIRRAFPDDGRGSRLLTTTQIEDVALACCRYQIIEIYPLENYQSRKLFLSIVFGSKDHVDCSEDIVSISDGIISKCGGVPLLIVNIASLFPTPSELNLQQWMDIRDSLPPTSRTNRTSEGIRDVLNFMYNNLSPELKTCLLYLVMYPVGYTVSKHNLVKQWVAEGFTGEGLNKEELAGEYFAELVGRGMIQAVDVNHGEVVSCTLHHMVHGLILKKSMERNFIIGVDCFQSAVWLRDMVRRLSVQFSGARSARIPAGIPLSEVRSVSYFGFYGCTEFIYDCTLLRVLTLHLWADDDTTTYDLSGISKLLPLRYLKVACNIDVQLPHEIEALQCLETLEVDATVVTIPFDIGQLGKLSSLKISIRVLSRREICTLQELPALTALSLHVSAEPVEMICFDKGEFPILKYFKFSCSVPWLKFEAGSMPDLQNFDLYFNAHEADQHGIVPIGIEHLSGLENITANIWGADTDVGSTFRTAITNHPRSPRINVHLVDPIFHGEEGKKQVAAEIRIYTSPGCPRVPDSGPGRSIEMSGVAEAIDLVSANLGIAGQISALADKAQRNTKKCKLLNEHVRIIMLLLNEQMKHMTPDIRTKELLEILNDALSDGMALVQSCLKKRTLSRVSKTQKEAKKFDALGQRISRILEQFHLANMTHIFSINNWRFFENVLQKLLRDGACKRLPQNVKEELKSSIMRLTNKDNMSPDAQELLEWIKRDITYRDAATSGSSRAQRGKEESSTGDYLIVSTNNGLFFENVLQKLLQGGACKHLPQNAKEELKSSIMRLTNTDSMSSEAQELLEWIKREIAYRDAATSGSLGAQRSNKESSASDYLTEEIVILTTRIMQLAQLHNGGDIQRLAHLVQQVANIIQHHPQTSELWSDPKTRPTLVELKQDLEVISDNIILCNSKEHNKVKRVMFWDRPANSDQLLKDAYRIEYYIQVLASLASPL